MFFQGMHLLQALRERKSDQALFQTCTYLSINNTDGLEDEWINIIAEIGMSGVLESSKQLWIQTILDLKTLIDAESIDIADALVMTTKLYLLYQRCATSVPDSLARLRDKVIDHFPNDARLSYKGVSLFEHIIPESDKDLHEFTHRILAGLIKLFHGNHVDAGRAVEFIARKKCVIPLPRVWPAPSPQEAARGDPIWFMWGAVMLYFPNDVYIQIAWSFFTLRWKRKYKMERLGLLVGSAMCAASSNTTVSMWTAEEGYVIEIIAHIAPDLWAAHTPPQLPNTHPKPAETNILDTFMPRCHMPNPDILALPDAPFDPQIKVVNIKDAKGRSKTAPSQY